MSAWFARVVVLNTRAYNSYSDKAASVYAVVLYRMFLSQVKND